MGDRLSRAKVSTLEATRNFKLQDLSPSFVILAVPVCMYKIVFLTRIVPYKLINFRKHGKRVGWDFAAGRWYKPTPS